MVPEMKMGTLGRLCIVLDWMIDKVGARACNLLVFVHDDVNGIHNRFGVQGIKDSFHQ